MMTVVDQVRPWFTPSRMLANDHPAPGRGEDQDEGHREADEPPGDEHGLAAVAIGERPGEEVRDRLHGAEGEDERQGGGERGDAERLVGEQREHGALLADHAADERVDADEQRELAEVLAQPEADDGRASPRSSGRCRGIPPSRLAQSSGPPVAHRDVGAASPFEHAGAGHRPFAVAAHHASSALSGSVGVG